MFKSFDNVVRLIRPRHTGLVYVIAIGGPVAAGKSTFSDKLIEVMKIEGMPTQFEVNYKLRPPRPSEIVGLDYYEVRDEEEWGSSRRKGEIPIEFQRNGIKYGFSRNFLEALRRNKSHQVVNLDIEGLVALRAYFQRHKIKNPVIPIGLYSDDMETRLRIFDREVLTEEQAENVASQFNSYPAQKSVYQRHYDQFRYVFYNSSSRTTIEHLIERAIDLLKKDGKYHRLNDEGFRQQYVIDQCMATFGMDPEELEDRLQHGERPILQFSEGDFQEYMAKFGEADISYLERVSEREVVTVTRAYGILNVLLDETNAENLNVQERLNRRNMLQQLLQIRLRVPQYVNLGKTLRLENISRVGLIESDNSMLSFLISFSPYDIFPLVASERHLLHVQTSLHTLSFESVYRRGEPVVQPLAPDRVATYAKMPL